MRIAILFSMILTVHHLNVRSKDMRIRKTAAQAKAEQAKAKSVKKEKVLTAEDFIRGSYNNLKTALIVERKGIHTKAITELSLAADLISKAIRELR